MEIRWEGLGVEFHRKQKPQLMSEVRRYMHGRFAFTGKSIPNQRMSGGRKAIMAGPVARLPRGVASFEALAQLPPDEIRRRDLFPFKPLAHPLQSTAHMVFPPTWLRGHPEHQRMDVDMDIPTDYLPEFPPPLFLTTHKELVTSAEARRSPTRTTTRSSTTFSPRSRWRASRSCCAPHPPRGSTRPITASR